MTYRRVGALSLLATYLFFFEYLPPFKRVHLTYDIEGYHYPLLDYAFQSLSQGRLPEWDPSIYCGVTFAGNVQAALFYPPNWLLFAVNMGRAHLRFLTLEILVIAHVWLAFWLCFIWLREKRLDPLAGALGAGVFAYSGYMLSQLQHVGVVTGCTWMPLGLWGIDQAARERNWRPLWKLVVASALCFLAGYPPAWAVFCACMALYAVAGPGKWRAAFPAMLALAASLVMAAVQLLPALEAAAGKNAELRFGSGIQAEVFASYFIPNYFNVGMRTGGAGDPTVQYYYLGAPAFFGLLWWTRRRALAERLRIVVLAAVSLAVMVNPLGIVEKLVSPVAFLSELLRSWSFHPGLVLAATLLAAVAVDDFLKLPDWPLPRLVTAVWLVVTIPWCLRQIWIGQRGGAAFASGVAGALDPITFLALFAVGLCLARSRRSWIAATLLAAVAVDYKAFGTSRRFNASTGDIDEFYAVALFRGLDDGVYLQIRANPEYRIALDETNRLSTYLRRYGLATPQGFDPFFSRQYRSVIEARTRIRDEREFDLDPKDDALLRMLGVRYFLTHERGRYYSALSSDPRFRLLEPAQSYFRVFELGDPEPSYRWEAAGGAAERLEWLPHRRTFRIRSAAGGRFGLIEQFSPGWRASVDGAATPIERWRGAFQAVPVTAGEHTVEFVFRSRALRIGAWITVLSLAALWGITRARKVN